MAELGLEHGPLDSRLGDSLASLGLGESAREFWGVERGRGAAHVTGELHLLPLAGGFTGCHWEVKWQALGDPAPSGLCPTVGLPQLWDQTFFLDSFAVLSCK